MNIRTGKSSKSIDQSISLYLSNILGYKKSPLPYFWLICYHIISIFYAQ